MGIFKFGSNFTPFIQKQVASLDGKKQGTFDGWNNTFNWDASKSALTLGLAYTGFIDDLAVFDRELNETEAQTVFSLRSGISELRSGAR